jgi:hypothetical protein
VDEVAAEGGQEAGLRSHGEVERAATPGEGALEGPDAQGRQDDGEVTEGVRSGHGGSIPEADIESGREIRQSPA